MDLVGYTKYMAGELESYSPPDSELKKYMTNLTKAEARKTGKW